MSSRENHNGADTSAPEQIPDPGSHNDSLAKKLSKELTNWRRQRNVSRPRRPEASNGASSEPARTIRVRGHETLVVRKPKIAPPAPAKPAQQND